MVIAKKTPSGLRPDSNSDLTLAVRELIRWCGRGDLNPHAFRRHPLKMVCLPVPPLPHVNKYLFVNYLNKLLQPFAKSTVCVFVCTFRIRSYADCAGFFFRLIRPNARLTDSARGCTYRI